MSKLWNVKVREIQYNFQWDSSIKVMQRHPGNPGADEHGALPWSPTIFGIMD